MSIARTTCAATGAARAPVSVERRGKLVLIFAGLCLLALAAGCGGSLYKVSPVVSAPISDAGKSAEGGGVSLSAVPLLADEESQELFEANLPLAGLLPVRVEIKNTGDAPLVLKKMRLFLSDAAGRKWKARSPEQAVSRIIKANDVTLYNPRARAGFQEAFGRHALDTATPLAPNERRQGLIFFQTPKKEPVESPRSLVLHVEGLRQPLELRLN